MKEWSVEIAGVDNLSRFAGWMRNWEGGRGGKMEIIRVEINETREKVERNADTRSRIGQDG